MYERKPPTKKEGKSCDDCCQTWAWGTHHVDADIPAFLLVNTYSEISYRGSNQKIQIFIILCCPAIIHFINQSDRSYHTQSSPVQSSVCLVARKISSDLVTINQSIISCCTWIKQIKTRIKTPTFENTVPYCTIKQKKEKKRKETARVFKSKVSQN